MMIIEWGPPFQAEGLQIMMVRQWMMQSGSMHQLQIVRTYDAVPEGLRPRGSSGWCLALDSLHKQSEALWHAMTGVQAKHTVVRLDQM